MNGTPPIFPAVPNATRWFAQLFMMEGFFKCERNFKIHFMESEKMHPISTIDWKNGRGFVDVLKPFEKATKIGEGEKYLTLSSIIPMLSILREKTMDYFKNPSKNGFGVTFARNILASVEDRFGKYPAYLLLKPHCFATFSDPRFSLIYFKQNREIETVREELMECVKNELAALEADDTETLSNTPNSSKESDTFWGVFDQTVSNKKSENVVSIKAEIRMWSGVSPLSRSTNPVHAMDALKRDFP